MPSHPTGLEYLRALPRPVIFEADDRVARYRLHASNEDEVLVQLEPWMSAPQKGRRLAMRGTEGYLTAIHLAVTVHRVVDAQWVVARWQSIAAADRPEYLAQVLHVLLGLERDVVVGVDRLPPGEQVVWEARSDRIRRLADTGRRDEQQHRLCVTDYVLSAEQIQKMLVVRPLAPPSPDVGSSKKLKRLHPVYPRDPARGYVSLGGERMFTALCTAIGSSHCVLAIWADAMPKLGAEVRLGIPLAPLSQALVWLNGKVVDLTQTAHPSDVWGWYVEVQLDRTKAIVPAEYTRLMTHFREQPPHVS